MSKEHEDEFLRSVPRQQSLRGHTWMFFLMERKLWPGMRGCR